MDKINSSNIGSETQFLLQRLLRFDINWLVRITAQKQVVHDDNFYGDVQFHSKQFVLGSVDMYVVHRGVFACTYS